MSICFINIYLWVNLLNHFTYSVHFTRVISRRIQKCRNSYIFLTFGCLSLLRVVEKCIIFVESNSRWMILNEFYLYPKLFQNLLLLVYFYASIYVYYIYTLRAIKKAMHKIWKSIFKCVFLNVFQSNFKSKY